MNHNIILAGVGGQGILTIARAISSAAVARGLHVKQAEVHGMSQRGGAVQSHLRISDAEIFSDLIPLGRADLIIAVEPLETLRYAQYLAEDGAVVASSNAFVNIGNYPPIEDVLDRIARFPQHVLLDVNSLARAAGSTRSANVVSLGAASLFLPFEPRELEEAVSRMFEAKGPKIVDANRRALRFGRNAAVAYREGLHRGGTPRVVRQWIDTLSPENLAAESGPDAALFEVAATEADRLSGAEAHAFEHVLQTVYDEGRRQLYEHEVYTLIELVGAISPPRYLFVPRGGVVHPNDLARFPGDRVVLKIVSPEIVHKTEANGIRFVPKDHAVVEREMEQLIAQHMASAQVTGVLVVEFVERTQPGFGNELFVGVRSTREFGPVIAAGLGGVDTEYLAGKMKPGVAVAKALASDISAEHFLDLFRHTAAYDILSGRARGHQRIVSDGELLRCFRAFISIARRFCVDRGETGPDVAELEVNPFAFRRQRMVPLDGRGRLGTATRTPPARPTTKIEHLLEPQSVAVLGVSATSMNFGRIIVNNIKDCGFPGSRLYIIKPGAKTLDGVACVPTVAALPAPVDLLVVAASADQMPDLVTEVVDTGKARTVIMIPGGMGETEGTRNLMGRVRELIQAGRSRPDGGPVFVGPNCMGVQSRPGRYDTFFIPENKLDPRRQATARRAAIISQSGAFIVSRLSNLQTLDPALTISLGNQIDLTVSDFLEVVARRQDIAAIGVYVEGFNDLDGLAFIRAVARAADAGKTVIFYKAGRTEKGQSAAAGHTASVAGDYDICQTAAADAGAIVVDTFKEFEQLLELATALNDKRVGGRRIAAITNAGFEAVGMADTILGARYAVTLPPLPPDAARRLTAILEQHHLAGLVNARNPLDLTPMAGESAYVACAQAMLDCDDFDALVVGVVPLTPALRTTALEIAGGGAARNSPTHDSTTVDSQTRPSPTGNLTTIESPAGDSLAGLIPSLFAEADKPIIAVIDSGPEYQPLARAIRAAGVPVFPSSDQAIRSLGRYLCHRTRGQTHAAPVAEYTQRTAEPVTV